MLKHLLRVKLLLITNIILTALLTAISLKENYPKRILKILFPPDKKIEISYRSYKYIEQTNIHSIYNKQKDIVFLGTSLTNGINWVELLDRCNVAKRGIGGDIIEGFIHRINNIINLNPKICFIEGGINDLKRGMPENIVYKNLTTLIDSLQKHNIKPVLSTVSYVTKSYNSSDNKDNDENDDNNNSNIINPKIEKLNKLIYKLAKDKKAPIIDLNLKISNGIFLKNEYAATDGLHYNSKAYSIWKEEVQKILEQEAL